MSNHDKVVHSQGRHIIYNVYKFILEEKEQGRFTTGVIERVAKATGVGLSTVRRICKEATGKSEGSTVTIARYFKSHHCAFHIPQDFVRPIQVKGTQKYHYFIPHSRKQMKSKLFSFLENEIGVNVGK